MFWTGNSSAFLIRKPTAGGCEEKPAALIFFGEGQGNILQVLLLSHCIIDYSHLKPLPNSCLLQIFPFNSVFDFSFWLPEPHDKDKSYVMKRLWKWRAAVRAGPIISDTETFITLLPFMERCLLLDNVMVSQSLSSPLIKIILFLFGRINSFTVNNQKNTIFRLI